MLLTITILLGALSGYTIRRLGSRRKLGAREAKLLPPLARILMALWLTLALALFLFEATR